MTKLSDNITIYHGDCFEVMDKLKQDRIILDLILTDPPYGTINRIIHIKPIIVNIDTVYIHSDIEEVNQLPDGTPVQEIYKYYEVQYTKDEYIQLMANKQNIESEFSTELDLNIQEIKTIQETEAELTTQHDIEILEIKKELNQLKEVLKKNEIIK